MALRTDDPVYYKIKLSDLIKQALNKGLKVECQHLKDGVMVSFVADNGDIASVSLTENVKGE
ncbi:MAG: hypothetical protein ABF633_02935 [Clostridium sp.]|uniref:hypothetical protein n=1 Tax=Clostridium sp. TaxID=1506 RepID=UPI0039E74CBD